MNPGDRIRISQSSRSLVALKGALGRVDHEVRELRRVYNETCYIVRLDDHSSHIQWESELELVPEPTPLPRSSPAELQAICDQLRAYQRARRGAW